MKTFTRSLLLLIFTVCIGSTLQTADAQSPPDLREHYLTPPDEIGAAVLAPRHKNVSLYNLNPNREVFLNSLEEGLSPLADYAKPYYNLGGLQMNPQANRQRYFTTNSTTGLQLIGARSGDNDEIETPDDAKISSSEWSPDGTKLAYFAHFDDATHIYVADVASGESRRITQRPVLATLNTSFEWSADGQYIFTVLVPQNRGKEPHKPQTPTTLVVKQTTDKENRLRTYQDLLEGAFEARLLEYHTTGQYARINVESGDVKNIGEPAMIRDIDVDPSGEYTIVETMQKPFSYIVPVYRFGWVEEIWDLDGNVMTELRKSKVDKGVPDGDEEEDYGRSEIEWRPDGQGLSMITETRDEDEENGDTNDDQPAAADDEENETQQEKEEQPYRVIQWKAPFGEEDQTVVYESDKQLESVAYADESDVLFITEEASGKEHLYAVYPDDPDTSYTIYKHDNDDFYEDPGNLMFTDSESGISVVRLAPDQEHVFLSGTQYYEDPQENAPRPFIDRVNIKSGEKERLFQSSEEAYERVAAVLNDEVSELVITRESATMHPDSWLVNLDSGEETKLTSNTDYNKAITNAQRSRFKVKRSDGFEFWVEVVMPEDWNGEPLPGLIWHYPTEYDDQEDYDESQRRYNKNNFPGVYSRDPEFLTKRGYAVINADWPIAAERGAPNDGFVWSIVQNSTVVIDSVVAKGFLDRERVAIGGHSYGAFGTANALIHTSFFEAGIAGDGNFNRTLTPMGFQREPRDLWRGQDRYVEMSPIFWADRLDGALLMYHGLEDQNVGTWPTNSRRMFHALNGIGKTAALYMYPHEAHGPGAKETILDLWTRWVNWLDHYVKNEGEHVPEAELGTD